MGYKLLGFIVWRGAKWYLSRRYAGTGRKVGFGVLALGGLGAAFLLSRRVVPR
jgi:MYXO-CTERM domain-containing protein